MLPFNIELVQKDISIKVQVVNKVITIYFNAEDDLAYSAREKWDELALKFIVGFPLKSKKEVFALSGAHHRKKHHANGYEQKTCHTHYPFSENVSPDLFSYFLSNVFAQQLKKDKSYHFFNDISEVQSIIDIYSDFYHENKGSTLSLEYKKENELTEEDKIEYQKDIEKEVAKKSKDVSLLSTLKILSNIFTSLKTEDNYKPDIPNFKPGFLLSTNENLAVNQSKTAVRKKPQLAAAKSEEVGAFGFKPGFLNAKPQASKPQNIGKKPSLKSSPSSDGFFGFKPGFLLNQKEEKSISGPKNNP